MNIKDSIYLASLLVEERVRNEDKYREKLTHYKTWFIVLTVWLTSLAFKFGINYGQGLLCP